MKSLIIALSIGISFVGVTAQADDLAPSFVFKDMIHEQMGEDLSVTLPEITKYSTKAELAKEQMDAGVLHAFTIAADTLSASSAEIEAARQTLMKESGILNIGVRTVVEVDQKAGAHGAKYTIEFYDKNHSNSPGLLTISTKKRPADSAEAAGALKASLQSALDKRDIARDYRDDREDRILNMAETLAEAGAKYAVIKAEAKVNVGSEHYCHLVGDKLVCTQVVVGSQNKCHLVDDKVICDTDENAHSRAEMAQDAATTTTAH